MIMVLIMLIVIMKIIVLIIIMIIIFIMVMMTITPTTNDNIIIMKTSFFSKTPKKPVFDNFSPVRNSSSQHNPHKFYSGLTEAQRQHVFSKRNSLSCSFLQDNEDAAVSLLQAEFYTMTWHIDNDRGFALQFFLLPRFLYSRKRVLCCAVPFSFPLYSFVVCVYMQYEYPFLIHDLCFMKFSVRYV